VAGFTAPVAAQSSVTAGDIQRLQDNVYDLSSEISRLRSRDRERASQLEVELDEIRDEVIYLRVKLRKEHTVARSEYSDLRDRIDDLRARATDTARGDRPSAPAVAPSTSRPDTAPSRSSDYPASTTDSGVIPVGQELDVRLQDTLNSGTNQVEDRFLATTVVDLRLDGRVLVPAGSEVRGVVSSVTSAGRVNRKASMTVTFDQITVNGRSYPIRGTMTEALEGGGYRGDAAKIGTGAGVGAIIGGILGGFKGALAGILIGGGGVVAATEGKEVELPAGTILRVRLDSPPAIR
jgi:TolA-binding protein